MFKIFFTCFWQTDILFLLKKNTPNNSSIWKNIEGTNDINICDYIVILDDLDKSLLQKGEKYFKTIIKNYDKIIFFQRENSHFVKQRRKSWFVKNILPLVKKKYRYEDKFLYTFTPANFLNMSYDELKKLSYKQKQKNISCIVSSKNIHKNYQKRMDFIKIYSNKYPNSIEIFGKGWNKSMLGNNFKGELGNYHRHDTNKTLSKFNGLYPYTYSICLENFPNDYIVSEKITDALLSWCMPIYWGSKYTSEYFPEDAFHLIDLDDPNVYEKVYKISQTPITEKNITAIKQARGIILDKLNIWEQIYQITNNYDTFLKKYKYD